MKTKNAKEKCISILHKHETVRRDYRLL